MSRLRGLVPLFIGIAVCVALIYPYAADRSRWGLLMDSLSAETWPLALLALSAQCSICLADAYAMHRTFTWLSVPMSFGRALSLRGRTYLLAALHYQAGQARRDRR